MSFVKESQTQDSISGRPRGRVGIDQEEDGPEYEESEEQGEAGAGLPPG